MSEPSKVSNPSGGNGVLSGRRGKSMVDIRNQADRLINRAEEDYNFSRMSRINQIAQRYRDNILATGAEGEFGPNVYTGGAVTNINPRERFPRSVYMGRRNNRRG